MNAVTLHLLVKSYYRDVDRIGSPAERDGEARLMAEGYWDAESDITPKGKVYVQACLDLPEPVEAWVMP